MAVAAPEDISCVEQIGHAAGLVWQSLESDGPLSLSKLVKQVEVPRDTVMQAVGWLARENKIEIEEGRRGKIISLR